MSVRIPRSRPMPRGALAPVLAAVAAMLAVPAQAQSVTPGWTLAPSYSILDGDEDWGVDKNGRGGGLKLGLPMSANTELQFGLNSAKASKNGVDYRQTLLGVDGLYKFNAGGKLRPFLSLGLGAERDRLSSVDKSRTSPYLSAGGGLQYWFTDRFALQADVKRVHGFLRSKGEDLFGTRSSNNNYFGLGLAFAFGGSGTAAPARAAAPAPAPAPAAAAAPSPAPAPAPAAAAAPAPAPAPAAAPARLERVTLDATELFEFRSAVLRMPQPKLDELADLMVRDASINKVSITGHTDRLGTKAGNQALSERRAQAVRNYLMAKGVDGARIDARGLGSSKPVKDCPAKQYKKREALIECLAPNRRVEIDPVSGQRPSR